MIHLKNTSTHWFYILQLKKCLLFQRVAFKIHAIIKTVYCFGFCFECIDFTLVFL